MSDLNDILADLDKANELLAEVRDILQSVKIDEAPSAEGQAIYGEKRLQQVEISVKSTKREVQAAIGRGVTSISAPKPVEVEPESEEDFEPAPGGMVYDVDDEVQEDL